MRFPSRRIIKLLLMVSSLPGDVTSGETLIVKAMEKGREGAQRVHEYLMGLEANHISFYEKYYTKLSYDRMLEGKNGTKTPPD